jgi:hypothetical protein
LITLSALNIILAAVDFHPIGQPVGGGALAGATRRSDVDALAVTVGAPPITPTLPAAASRDPGLRSLVVTLVLISRQAIRQILPFGIATVTDMTMKSPAQRFRRLCSQQGLPLVPFVEFFYHEAELRRGVVFEGLTNSPNIFLPIEIPTVSPTDQDNRYKNDDS